MNAPGARSLCHWAACGGCESRLPAGDFSAARRWVAGALADAAQAHALRARVATLPGIALAISTDHQLAEQLVHAIALGTLRVCAGGAPRRLLRLAAQTAPAPAPASSAAPAPRRSAAPPPPAPAPAEPPIDAPAMAQALREASASGVPFCEECARAAATA